jgi:hypothetical protein
MKALRFGVLFAAWALLLLPVSGQQDKRPLTAQEIAAVKTAILDEIYDYRFEGAYVDISPLESSGYTLPLYIRPTVIAGGGQVIYKLPIGEVARVFEFKGSLAVLIREPRDKFPPTSSSMLTLYLDDAEICSDKKHWIHEVLFINPHPSKKVVQEAVMRQRERKGTSQHDEIAKSHR